jgi:hypothetical protein
MNRTDYTTLTYEMGQAQDQLLGSSCLDPRGEWSDGDSHGDVFARACCCAAADTPSVSEFPILPRSVPRDDDELRDDD